MYPIIFSIGRIHLYTHGLMMALGAILGGLIIYFLAKQRRLETSFLFDLFVYSILAGLIFSRIAYVVLYYNQFSSFREVLAVWYGGLVSYGGIIGGFVIAAWFLHYKRQSIAMWFDLSVIGLMVGWALGRVGCFLAGDSLGVVSSSALAIWGRLPSQLFEGAASLIVAALCYFLLIKKEKLRLPDGLIFWAGMGMYSLGRFVVDFFRDEKPLLLFLKPGQLASVGLFVICVLFIGMMIKRNQLQKAGEEV